MDLRPSFDTAPNPKHNTKTFHRFLAYGIQTKGYRDNRE